VKKRKTEEVLHSKEAVKLPADNSAPSQSIGLPISNKITKEIIKRVKPSPLDEEDAADEDVDRAKITTSLTPSPNPSVDSRPKVSVAKRKELEEKSHIPSTITEPNIAIVTAPNTPTVEVSTATPSSSSKIIKKRIINVSGHDPLSLPSSEQSSLPSPKPVVSQPSQNMNGVYPKPTKGLKFCPYCKKLEKHHMCSNPLHQPDGYYGESREEIEKRTGKQVPAIMKPLLPPPELKSGEQLCPYCKGLGKKLKCENQYHHDGRPLNKNAGAEDNKSMPVHEPHFKPPDLKRHDEDRKERERYKQKKHETVTISIDSDRQSSMFVWKTSGPDLQLKPKKSCLKKTSCFDMSDDRNESNFHMETGSSTVAKKKVHWIEATARGQLGDTVYFVSEISEDPPTPSSPSYLL
jgi:glutaredoxin